MGGAGVFITRTFSIEFQEVVMAEQNIETAIAAYKKYNDVYCDINEDLGRYLKDTYRLLSQLIVEGYDFKPDSLDDPAILRKRPDFIPTKIPALWQTFACQGSRCTNTLCPDIQAIVNKAVGLRRPATSASPEYRRCDSKAQAIAKRAFEAALRILWFLREYIEDRCHAYKDKDYKDINPFILWSSDNNLTFRGIGLDTSEFTAPHGIDYWQGQIDALFEELPARPLENPADVEQFKKIIEIARLLKLTPGSKDDDSDCGSLIEGTAPLSRLFDCFALLEHKTAEDILFALKAICPDIHDWDIVVGALFNPACQPHTFQETLSRLAAASDLPSSTATGNTTAIDTPSSDGHV